MARFTIAWLTTVNPVRPPLAPMLASLARELPQGDFLYEPKWDGFRCIVFRDGRAREVPANPTPS